MNHVIHNGIVNFIWGIADDVLRDVYVRGKYRDVILPFTVLRRLDAVLEEKRAAAAKEAEDFAQQQRDAAKAQADKILSDAKDAAESERQKIVAEANREAVAIAEDAMEKLMAAQTAQAYDAFVNAAKEEQNEH